MCGVKIDFFSLLRESFLWCVEKRSIIWALLGSKSKFWDHTVLSAAEATTFNSEKFLKVWSITERSGFSSGKYFWRSKSCQKWNNKSVWWGTLSWIAWIAKSRVVQGVPKKLNFRFVWGRAEGEGFTSRSDIVTHPSNKFKANFFQGHPIGLKLFHWTGPRRLVGPKLKQRRKESKDGQGEPGHLLGETVEGVGVDLVDLVVVQRQPRHLHFKS